MSRTTSDNTTDSGVTVFNSDVSISTSGSIMQADFQFISTIYNISCYRTKYGKIVDQFSHSTINDFYFAYNTPLPMSIGEELIACNDMYSHDFSLQTNKYKELMNQVICNYCNKRFNNIDIHKHFLIQNSYIYNYMIKLIHQSNKLNQYTSLIVKEICEVNDSVIYMYNYNKVCLSIKALNQNFSSSYQIDKEVVYDIKKYNDKMRPNIVTFKALTIKDLIKAINTPLNNILIKPKLGCKLSDVDNCYKVGYYRHQMHIIKQCTIHDTRCYTKLLTMQMMVVIITSALMSKNNEMLVQLKQFQDDLKYDNRKLNRVVPNYNKKLKHISYEYHVYYGLEFKLNVQAFEASLIEIKERTVDLRAKDYSPTSDKSVKFATLEAHKKQQRELKLIQQQLTEMKIRQLQKIPGYKYDEQEVERQENRLLFDKESQSTKDEEPVNYGKDYVPIKIKPASQPYIPKIEFVSPNDMSDDEEDNVKDTKRTSWEKGIATKDKAKTKFDDNYKKLLSSVIDKINRKMSNLTTDYLVQPKSLNKVLRTLMNIEQDIKFELEKHNKMYSAKGKINVLDIKQTNYNLKVWEGINKMMNKVLKEENEHHKEIKDIAIKMDAIIRRIHKLDLRVLSLATGVSLQNAKVTSVEVINALESLPQKMPYNIKVHILEGMTICNMTTQTTLMKDDTIHLNNGIIKVHDILSPKVEIEGKLYTSPVALHHDVCSKIESKFRYNDVLEKIVKNTNMIVLDLANMTKSMKLTIDQIEQLIRIFNSVGIVTVSVNENNQTSLQHVPINIVIDEDEHDDIVTLLYSHAYNAVIITNDQHKEFVEHITYCEKHKELIIRKNELCPQNDGNCVTRILKLAPTRYMSIKSFTSLTSSIKIVFNNPVIRFRGQRIKGTSVMSIQKEDIREPLNIERKALAGDKSIWLTNVTMPISKLNFSVTSFTLDNIMITVADYGSYTAISHIIAHLTDLQLQRINSLGLSIVDLDDDGNTIIRETNNKELKIRNDDIVSSIRHKAVTNIISNIFNVQGVLPTPSTSKNLIKSIDKFNEQRDWIDKIIISKVMLSKKICVLKSKTKLVLATMTNSYVNHIIDLHIKTETKDKPLNKLINSTIVDHNIMIDKLRGSLLSPSQYEHDMTESQPNTFAHMLLGPPLARQMAEISTQTSDMRITMQDAFILIPVNMKDVFTKKKEGKIKLMNAAQSKTYYEIAIQGHEDWIKVPQINVDNKNDAIRKRNKRMMRQKQYNALFEGDYEEEIEQVPLSMKQRMEIRKAQMLFKRMPKDQKTPWKHNPWRSADYGIYIPNEFTLIEEENYEDIAKIIYVLNEDEVKTTLSGISKKDAKLLISSFETHGNPIIKKIMIDIIQSLVTILGGKKPAYLPPFIWSYEDSSITMTDPLLRSLVLMKVATPDYNCDVWFWTYTKCIVTIRFKPGYWTLFPTMALMHGNNFKNLPEMVPRIKMEVDVQFSIFKESKVVQENIDMFFDYYKVYSIPLRLIGIAPMVQLVKYKPTIVDNVVDNFEVNEDIYWADHVVPFNVGIIVENDYSDNRFYAEPIERMIDESTKQIDIAKEIHEIIDKLVIMQHVYCLEDAVPVYMSMFRPLYEWTDITKHLKYCYKQDIIENASFKDVVRLIEKTPTLICHKCVYPQFQQNIMERDVLAIKDIGSAPKITTAQGTQSVIMKPNITVLRQKQFKIHWLSNDCPIRGKYQLIIMSLAGKKNKHNRYTSVLNLIEARNDMIVQKENIVIHRSTNICHTLSDNINLSFSKNRSVILLATDTIGSLIKKYDDSIFINNREKKHRLYIPDILLYNAVRSKIELIEDQDLTIMEIESQIERNNKYTKNINNDEKLYQQEDQDVEIHIPISYNDIIRFRLNPKITKLIVIMMIVLIILSLLSPKIINLPYLIYKLVLTSINLIKNLSNATTILTIVSDTLISVLGIITTISPYYMLSSSIIAYINNHHPKIMWKIINVKIGNVITKLFNLNSNN